MKVKCFNKKTDERHVQILQSQLSVCRVCGYDYVDWFPWGEHGCDPTFGICPCCNVEFGYEDSDIEAIHAYRQEWIAKGASWDRPDEKPKGWSLEEALANIPDAFK